MTSGAEARNHHWVPQCYLKGFAKSRSKKAQLFVVDLVDRKTFQTVPRNVASARDFNRVDIPGVPPNQIESGYATFESQVDGALERIVSAKRFGDWEDHNLILNLIALFSVRNPRVRENSRQFQEQVVRRMMDLTVATKERYESTIGKAERAGDVEASHGVSYERMRDFVDSGEYTIEVPTTRHVEQEIMLVDTVLPLLGKRSWLLYTAPPNSGGFITSDHPAVLDWQDQRERRGPFSSPGFGLRGTHVIFPVTQDLVMYGAFGGETGVQEASHENVAIINGIIAAHAKRQIYAKDDRFKYELATGGIRWGADILQDLQIRNPKS